MTDYAQKLPGHCCNKQLHLKVQVASIECGVSVVAYPSGFEAVIGTMLIPRSPKVSFNIVSNEQVELLDLAILKILGLPKD